MPLGTGALLAITGGLKLAGSIAQNVANRRKSKRELRINKSLIMEQNRYNSPSQQMKRLRDAGINPNLVYGSQGVTGNMQGDIPRYTEPDQVFETPSMMEVAGSMGKYVDVERGRKQIDNLVQDTALKKSKTETEGLMRAIMDIKKNNDLFDLNYKRSLESTNRDIVKNTLEKGYAELKAYEIANKISDYRYEKIMPQELDNYIKENAFKDARNMLASRGLTFSDGSNWQKILTSQIASNLPRIKEYIIETAAKYGITPKELQEASSPSRIKIFGANAAFVEFLIKLYKAATNGEK